MGRERCGGGDGGRAGATRDVGRETREIRDAMRWAVPGGNVTSQRTTRAVEGRGRGRGQVGSGKREKGKCAWGRMIAMEDTRTPGHP